MIKMKKRLRKKKHCGEFTEWVTAHSEKLCIFLQGLPWPGIRENESDSKSHLFKLFYLPADYGFFEEDFVLYCRAIIEKFLITHYSPL
jgi:hypothetical protein